MSKEQGDVVPDFTDWSRANLIKEVRRARKSEQRYQRALEQILEWSPRWECDTKDCDICSHMRIARKALGEKK
jgi:hypothetical protein